MLQGLPPAIEGTARASLASSLVRDWHPATRDNYLAAFADFERWHVDTIGPLSERVDGHAIL